MKFGLRLGRLEAQRAKKWNAPSPFFSGEMPDATTVAKSIAALSDEKLRDLHIAQGEPQWVVSAVIVEAIKRRHEGIVPAPIG